MNESEALLEQLRGVSTPAVSQLPAPGWWVSALGLLILMLIAWLAYGKYRRRAWVRDATLELQNIRKLSETKPVAESLASASRLTRRILLAARPRSEVAQLHGDHWLEELDRLCGRDLFTQGYGQMLKSAPYQSKPAIKQSDLQGLFDVIAELINVAGKQSTGRESN
jgi:hypothetical protein